ncbi:MAG: hypothetical protein ACE5HL_12625 [Terriglobia bacterium]
MEYEGLARRYAELDDATTRQLLDPYFLGVVDELASSMAPALLEKVPALRTGPAHNWRAYLGALVIEGYQLGRVWLNNVKRGRILASALPSTKALVDKAIHERYLSAKPADILLGTSPAFQALFDRTLDVWMVEKGVHRIQDGEKLMGYLVLMMLNGLSWAFTEDQVVPAGGAVGLGPNGTKR